MSDPEQVLYERWWNVSNSGHRVESKDFCTLAEAMADAERRLRDGIYGVTIYRSERPVRE